MKLIPLIILFFICCSALASATTTVRITPTSKVLVVGETFNITLTVTPDQDVDTVGIDLLTWNKDVLDCISVQQGNLFPESLVWLGGKINNTAGKLEWMVVASNMPIHTENILCNITFRVKAPGISTIAIDQFAVARNGSSIPNHALNNCQITIDSPYTPPPPADPPITPPAQTNTTNDTCCGNQTTPPENNTIPVNDTTPPDNETYIPIENNTLPINQTTDDAALPPNNNQETIPTTILIYLLIIIIVIGIVAYAIVRHYKNKQDDEDDEQDDIDDFISKLGGPGDDETSSGNQL